MLFEQEHAHLFMRCLNWRAGAALNACLFSLPRFQTLEAKRILFQALLCHCLQSMVSSDRLEAKSYLMVLQAILSTFPNNTAGHDVT